MMTTIGPKISLQQAMDVASFWNEQMPMMAMEEAGELIQAISKVERAMVNWKGDINYARKTAALAEEIRDMYISLAALMVHYSINPAGIQVMIDEKLKEEKDG